MYANIEDKYEFNTKNTKALKTLKARLGKCTDNDLIFPKINPRQNRNNMEPKIPKS